MHIVMMIFNTMSVDGSNFQADMDALRLYYDALCEHSKDNLDKQCKKDNTGKGETLTFATLKAYIYDIFKKF